MENLDEGYTETLCRMVLYPMCDKWGATRTIVSSQDYSGPASYAIQVHTYNHGDVLELQNGGAK